MSITISGVVTNGVVVPSAPLPEGARVEIQLTLVSQEDSDSQREKARSAALDHLD